MTLLYVHQLSAADSSGRLVLDGVSLHLDPGQVVGIAGGPGAGKSLLCSIVAGAIPDGLSVVGGRILLGNRDLAATPWQNDGVVAYGIDGDRLRDVLISIYDSPADVPSAPASREIGTLVIDRSPAALAPICDDIAVLCAGRLVERGPAKSVLEAPRHPYTEALIAGDNRLEDAAAALAGCPWRPSCRHAIESCATAPMRLQMVAPDHATLCARRRDLWPIT